MAEELEIHLIVRAVVEDADQLQRVGPPAMNTTSGGLTAPSDDMRAVTALATVLLGLREGIRNGSGLRVLEVTGLDVGK